MKKTILAVAMTAAMASGSVFAAEIYSSDAGAVVLGGHLRTQLQKVGDSDVKLNAGSSRVSIGATYGLTDSIDALGYVEFGLSGNGGELENRLHYTGVVGDFGSLTFGRQWTVADDFGSADVSYFYGGGANTSTSFTSGRHDSLIKYSHTIGSVSFAVGYGLGANAEDNDQQEIAEANINAVFGPFTIGGSFGTAEDLNLIKGKKVEADYGTAVATYTIDALTLLAGASAQTVSVDGQDLDSTGYQATATYSWSEKATAYAGYEAIEYKAAGLKEDGSFFYVGTDYRFNSFARIYVEVARVDGSAINISNDSANNVTAKRLDDETAFGAGFRVYW
ncbi:porin [Thaumasiovibrio sp. DFM-14]|uniref:porin n=1 Tax=Thaumasiovibrio sp. DFM-14 TaxID=3384792 RepID=UPI0039A1279E